MLYFVNMIKYHKMPKKNGRLCYRIILISPCPMPYFVILSLLLEIKSYKIIILLNIFPTFWIIIKKMMSMSYVNYFFVRLFYKRSCLDVEKLAFFI